MPTNWVDAAPAWLEATVFAAAATGVVLLMRALRVALARHRRRFAERVGTQLADAFVFVAPERLWWINLAVGAAAALAAALALAAAGGLAAAAAAALGAGLVPRWLLRRLRARRRARLREQLPDALMLMAGGLRAGQALSQAIASTVAEVSPPLSQEFELLLREQRLGRSLEQALASIERRNPIEELALLGAAVRVAAGTGGNLAEALDRLAETLRATLALEAKIDALTAQGRLQAWVMAALPPLLALVLMQLDPAAMRPLFETAMGRTVCAAVALLDLAGLFWIRKLTRIDP